MKRLNNFSGGLCSFFAAKRDVEQFGSENVVLLFADTLIEDDDLYEFLERASGLLGVPITRVSREMTPWELFRKEGMIANNRFPICSVRLKRAPLNEWMEKHYQLDETQSDAFLEPATCVLGFDWTELHRVIDFQNEHPNWSVAAPMTEPPLWDKCKMISEAEKLGFKTPSLYVDGFPHNNCGGACVRAGITQWVHLYHIRPKTYSSWENNEQITLKDFAERGVSNGHFTILKDRRGGETKPLSLRDLRVRIEAGEEFSKLDWGGCGCGGATTTFEEAA